VVGGVCRTYYEPRDAPEDVAQLQSCGDQDHCKREPQKPVAVCDPVGNNEYKRAANRRNKNKHFEA